jgi:hypothetical protein
MASCRRLLRRCCLLCVFVFLGHWKNTLVFCGDEMDLNTHAKKAIKVVMGMGYPILNCLILGRGRRA